MFFLTTPTPGLPKPVVSALEEMTSFTTGMSVRELIMSTVSKVQDVMSQGNSVARLVIIDEDIDISMPDATSSPRSDSQFGDDWPEDPDMESFDSEYLTSLSTEAAHLLNQRIRQDLRLVKGAGFKIGIIQGCKADSSSSILSISIQVNHLSLSEEVLQAWNLQLQEYIVLLIRYRGTYKTFENVLKEPASNLDIKFHLGVCDKYKPSISEAVATLDNTKPLKSNGRDEQDHELPEPTMPEVNNFRDLFISSSLNQLLQDQFISLLKIRAKGGLDWDGAQRYLHDRQGRLGNDLENGLEESYTTPATTKIRPKLLPFLEADHINDGNNTSFPLVSIQFAIKHLVRCTEYCLVCHSHVEDDFEALKPYVCSKPLCLYQYMALGYGPSIEHEIVTQPNVVDLLISFCYSSARSNALREYPTGLALKVPLLPDPGINVTTLQSAHHGGKKQEKKKKTRSTKIFDASKNQITFSNVKELCPVRPGDWVMVNIPEGTSGSLTISRTH